MKSALKPVVIEPEWILVEDGRHKSSYPGAEANIELITSTSQRLDNLSVEQLRAFYSWWSKQDGDEHDAAVCRSSQMRALLPVADYQIISNRLDQYEATLK